MLRFGRDTSVFPLLFALLVGFGDAQAQGWVADVSAGQIVHKAVPGNIGTLGATFGIRREGLQWLYASAGIPFDSAGAPWGALGAGGRIASSGFLSAGVDVSAQAYGFQDPASRASGGGVSAEAMPLLSAQRGLVALAVRSGLLHHSSAFSGQSASRTVHASDAHLSLGSAALRVTGESRYLRAEEGNYPYLGASFEAAGDRGALWASAGKWISDVVQTPVWGAGARLAVAGRTEVYASFQQEANDPLFWNIPRKLWSVGVSRRLGRPMGSLPIGIIQPAAPEMSADGVTFRLPLSAASEPPALGGDFTGWKPVPMNRDGEFWVLTLPIARGSHRFAFRRGEGDWFVPESVPGRTDDGMGGTVAVLIVP